MLGAIARRLLPGVSWQNPLVHAVLLAGDPIDYLVRLPKGLGDLPRFSVRVRSNGVRNQFGGDNFARYGTLLAELLKRHAGLRRDSRVLEVGCGCGRTALALARELDDGGYMGVDIERVSLESCRRNRLLRRKGFRFDLMDVQNDEYNPAGSVRAAQYRFPYEDGAFEVIFLVSVFTHMRTADVRNYVGEIARMLKPGGACMLTALLMDHGTKTRGMSFPFVEEEHYFFNRDMPEVAIGYRSQFFADAFRAAGCRPSGTYWGSWRNDPAVQSDTGFPQDVVVFVK